MQDLKHHHHAETLKLISLNEDGDLVEWLCYCEEDEPAISLALPLLQSHIGADLPQILLVKPFPPPPRIAIKKLESSKLHTIVSGKIA